MDTDVITKIGAVRREVVAREHAGRPARVVIASRTYDAPIDDVWDALTSAERIPRWLLPISGELRRGGRYRLEGNAEGEITTCDRPQHLAVTWEYGGDVSWVDVGLTEDGDGGTRLRLEHVAHVSDERWAEFGPGAVGVGWDLTLLGLDEHLSTGRAVEADPGSADGREFMRRSSDDWCQASIAGGTPEEEARGAAERTTAAYAGGGEETAAH